MRTLNLAETYFVTGAGVQPRFDPIPPAAPAHAHPVTVVNNIHLMSDLLNTAGILGGAYLGSSFMATAGMASYVVKGIDVGSFCASAVGSMFGAVGGYAASKLFQAHVLSSINPYL